MQVSILSALFLQTDSYLDIFDTFGHMLPDRNKAHTLPIFHRFQNLCAYNDKLVLKSYNAESDDDALPYKRAHMALLQILFVVATLGLPLRELSLVYGIVDFDDIGRYDQGNKAVLGDLLLEQIYTDWQEIRPTAQRVYLSYSFYSFHKLCQIAEKGGLKEYQLDKWGNLCFHAEDNYIPKVTVEEGLKWQLRIESVIEPYAPLGHIFLYHQNQQYHKPTTIHSKIQVPIQRDKALCKQKAHILSRGVCKNSTSISCSIRICTVSKRYSAVYEYCRV